MSVLSKLVIHAIEGALRHRSKRRYREPLALAWQHFGPGGLAEAEALCETANRDPLAPMRIDDDVEPAGRVERRCLSRPDAKGSARVVDEITFDSPLPTGCPINDRVHLRVFRRGEALKRRDVAIFHPSLRHDSWGFWSSFLDGVSAHIPVAIMAAPHHFERARPGEYGGQRTACANPWRMYEAVYQWVWDQAAAQSALARVLGLRTAACIGFSFGSYQLLLAAAAGSLSLPLVTIAPTNRYAWALRHGWVGSEVGRQLRHVGIDDDRLARIMRGGELHRHVGELRGRDLLYLEGLYDRVDPPPSLDLLREALRPERVVMLPAGHGTMVLYRQRISREIVRFFEDVGVLRVADARSAPVAVALEPSEGAGGRIES